MRVHLLLLVASLAMACNTSRPPPSGSRGAVDGAPDLVLAGGNVVTMDPARPRAEAIALRGEEIVFVGTAQEARALAGPSTKTVDLAGATVIPGLIDAHAHVPSLGFELTELSLQDTRSWDEVVAKVAARAKETPAGQWIVGNGWDQNDWPVAEFPRHDALSKATPDHPVVLYRIDGHAAIANAKALAIAGVDAKTPDPKGGRILRGKNGVPRGVLVDAAMGLVSRHVPDATIEETRAAILRAQEEILRHGIVAVHDMGMGRQAFAAYEQLEKEGKLHLRIHAMLRGGDAAWVGEWLARGPRQGKRLNVRGIKFFADGALGSRGAALLAPYADEPGNRGLVTMPRAELAEKTAAAVRAGFQVCVHAIGDAANRTVLDAFGDALAATGAKDARLRVEHAQVIAPEDLPRFAALGVIASMQPTHATSDMPWAGKRLGAERVRGAYAWATLRKHGARIAAGSDFPVEGVNPLWGYYAAFTRTDRKGEPAGGWTPEERMTREEALAAFTVDAAWAEFAEARRGALRPGMAADLVVLDTDVLAAPAADVLRAKVLRTVIAGRTVYERAPGTSASK